MYKVDLWIWVESRDPSETVKFWAYSLECMRGGQLVSRTAEGQRLGSWNKVTLAAIADALERFRQNAEVVMHCENRWVLNMLIKYLDLWEGADFVRSDKKKVAHEDVWRRIAKAKHGLLIRTDEVGFDRSEELMDKALGRGDA